MSGKPVAQVLALGFTQTVAWASSTYLPAILAEPIARELGIARGTLPLALFGSSGYGYRQGLLGVLARSMQAIAPFAFGLVLEIHGVRAAIALSACLSLIALGALLALRTGKPAAVRA